MQHQVRQFRRDDMRQVARTAHQFIMRGGRQRQQAAPDRFPQLVHFAQGRGVRLARRRDDTHGLLEQVRARRRDARLFRAGHRMASDEMRSGARDERFQLLDDAAFNAADIRNDHPALQSGQQLLHQALHLRDRRAKHDQVRVRSRVQQVHRRAIHRAGLCALRDAGPAPHITHHQLRKPAPFQRQAQRTAEQPHSHQRHFVPAHRASLKVRGLPFKLSVCSSRGNEADVGRSLVRKSPPRYLGGYKAIASTTRSITTSATSGCVPTLAESHTRFS